MTEDKKFVLKIEKPSLKRKFSLKMKEKMEQHQLNKCIKRENKKKELIEKLRENTNKMKLYFLFICLLLEIVLTLKQLGGGGGVNLTPSVVFHKMFLLKRGCDLGLL